MRKTITWNNFIHSKNERTKNGIKKPINSCYIACQITWYLYSK